MISHSEKHAITENDEKEPRLIPTRRAKVLGWTAAVAALGAGVLAYDTTQTESNMTGNLSVIEHTVLPGQNLTEIAEMYDCEDSNELLDKRLADIRNNPANTVIQDGSSEVYPGEAITVVGCNP